MDEEERFSLIRRPGASVFFTWIALSAAIFFGAYSVRLKSMYDKEIAVNSEIKSKERELSYRLELASVKIKESVSTIEWSNVEINRLRQRNDEVQDKIASMRKLLYASLKKNRDRELSGGKEASTQFAEVTPKRSSLLPEKPLETEKLGGETIFPELTRDSLNDAAVISELIKKNSVLPDKANDVLAEVLTYNPSSKKVFINLGRSNADIAEGNRFAIWRNGAHVTDVRVAQVHSVTSTCEVISPDLMGIRAGDVAELVEISAF